MMGKASSEKEDTRFLAAIILCLVAISMWMNPLPAHCAPAPAGAAPASAGIAKGVKIAPTLATADGDVVTVKSYTLSCAGSTDLLLNDTDTLIDVIVPNGVSVDCNLTEVAVGPTGLITSTTQTITLLVKPPVLPPPSLTQN